MIEINLLPPEYRPREKTNLPLIMTIAVGLFLVGGIFVYYMKQTQELRTLTKNEDDLLKKKAKLEIEAAAVKELRTKIARAKARQDTIVDISQSKVMWSLKLQQLSRLMGEFPGVWLKRISLLRGGGGNTLELGASATGGNLTEVARFREALKHDPNFFYHFASLNDPRVQKQDLAEDLNYKERMDFSLRMPLKGAGGKKKAKRRRR